MKNTYKHVANIVVPGINTVWACAVAIPWRCHVGVYTFNCLYLQSILFSQWAISYQIILSIVNAIILVFATPFILALRHNESPSIFLKITPCIILFFQG